LSIRLRLTLLYTAILVATLVVLGLALYAAVSSVTVGATSDEVTVEARTIAISLQPHIGPGPGPGGPNQGMSRGPVPLPTTSGAVKATVTGPRDLGPFVPPPDVAVQSSIQVRDPRGTVLYQSADLKAGKVVLPLSSQARQRLQPGRDWRTIVTIGSQRLVVVTKLLTARGAPSGILQVARSLHDVDATLSTLRRTSLAGGAIATLLALVAGWWLAGTALRPIIRLTRTAQEIGATQDFSRRVAYDGPADELGRLAGTLNTMLSRLQAAYHAQRRFVSDASHELRTPLTSIRGNLGLLQRDPPIADADRAAVLEDLVSESDRLSRLVSDLLTIARGDSGQRLKHEPVTLSPLVDNVVRRLAVLHPDRIVQEAAGEPVTALGDADAVMQVLFILLDNALKFTPVEGTVTVLAAESGQGVTIEVRDTGPGIAPETLPHIFERFYQGDTARAGSGTGLGLAIAWTLVHAMQGTIAVQSVLGQGSLFTVTLRQAP
jgi:two-component system OmpR family sensor kinase